MTPRQAEVIKYADRPTWQIEKITGEKRAYIYATLSQHGIKAVTDREHAISASREGIMRGAGNRDNDNPGPPLRLVLTRAEIATARAMRAEGRSIEEIGRVFHMSPERVRRTINHNH